MPEPIQGPCSGRKEGQRLDSEGSDLSRSEEQVAPVRSVRAAGTEETDARSGRAGGGWGSTARSV